MRPAIRRVVVQRGADMYENRMERAKAEIGICGVCGWMLRTFRPDEYARRIEALTRRCARIEEDVVDWMEQEHHQLHAKSTR